MSYKQPAFYAVLIIMVSTAFLCTTSCKKKSTAPTMGTFWFHLHTNIDTNEVDDTTALYRDSSGRHFGLTVAQFFVSGVTLHNVLGTYYTIPNAIVLKNVDSEQYLIGQAPAGIYDDVSFTVGLPAATNGLSPTAFTNTGYIPNSAMWFGNAADGYMYLKVEGFADTTAAQNGTNLTQFSYEIGKIFAVGGPDQALKTVAMPQRTGTLKPYVLSAGSTTFIHLICDYGKLLSGIDFKTQYLSDTHSQVNSATSATIIAGIPNMFRYEE